MTKPHISNQIIMKYKKKTLQNIDKTSTYGVNFKISYFFVTLRVAQKTQAIESGT